MEFTGISADDVTELQKVLGVEPEPQKDGEQPPHRMGSELLSAAFILGILNAAPALITAVADVLLRMRESKYFTLKLVLDDKTIVEGAATPDRIATLTASMEQIRKLQK
jgi:hypothetical protein